MEEKGCFAISFDKSRVVIRCEGRTAFELLDFSFKENLHSIKGSALPLFTLKTTNAHTLALYQGEKQLCQGEQGKVAVRLLDRVIYQLAKETKGGLLFHAAALSRNGKSVLVPGQSGSGKTFFAAGLADSGYSYLTDEMTLVESKTFFLSGFYKPLHIKNPVAFENMISIKTTCSKPANSGGGNLPVNKGFLTNCFHDIPENKEKELQPAIIIFPKYEDGNELDLKPLPCAKTGMLLMQTLINARNLVSHGFHDIATLSREVPAYKLTYGNFSRVVRAVDGLLAL